MSILYLDLSMGAAGDMMAAALYELLSENDKKDFIRELSDAGIPGTEISVKDAFKNGIKGTGFFVSVNGTEEESDDDHDGQLHDHDHEHHHGRGHDHEHDHHHDRDHEHHHGHGHDHHHDHEHDHEYEYAHHHDHEGQWDDHEHSHHHDHDHDHHHDHHHGHDHIGHSHVSMKDIEETVGSLKLSESVKKRVMEVYRIIAQAESRAHGVEVSEVHFHEVGMMDAIADISAVCLAIEKLAPEKIMASYICTGYGQVRCMHGMVPVPAPATANILEGIPFYSGDIQGELCTPTGAALVKYFVQEFGRIDPIITEKTGYGMGKKEFERANVLRAFSGKAAEPSGGSEPAQIAVDKNNGKRDEIIGLFCNIDDMTGEEIGFATEIILEAGALDVYTMQAGMKKSRPGVILSVLCRPEDKERFVELIFKHTTTLGIRESRFERYILERSIAEKETDLGRMRFKEASGYGTDKVKPEFEDMAKAAVSNNESLFEVRKRI